MLDINEWIRILEYGHKFKVRIWCRGETSNILNVDFNNKIHNNELCNYIKSSKKGLDACISCRNTADKKAERNGGYTGYCLHGMFETVYPVTVNGKCIATVYITNMYDGSEKAESLVKRACDNYGLSFKKAKRLLSSYDKKHDEGLLLKTAEAAAEVVKLHFLENADNCVIRHPKTVSDLMLIAEDHENNESLKKIAERMFLNEKYLGRLFKTEVGCTFSEYRNKKRMEDAAGLLSDTALKIIDIAIAVGYDNVEYFNRIFKSEYGMTPSKYREKYSR